LACQACGGGGASGCGGARDWNSADMRALLERFLAAHAHP
jgi:hypothetical protein